MTSPRLNVSLTAALFQQLQTSLEKTAVVFRDTRGEEIFISRRSLLQKTKRYASALKKQGVLPGQMVIIALRHTPELIFTLLGTWFAGAVPSLFPYKDFLFSGDAYHTQLSQRLIKSKAPWLITLDESAETIRKMTGKIQSCIIPESALNKEDFIPGFFNPETNHTGEETAYVQYTSGTTGHNKGVLLSHRAVTGMLDILKIKVHHCKNDVIVNWLPLYHDFGLFAGFLLPLYAGLTLVLISPFAWLRNPEIWLDAIHRYKGTITYTPNSGLEHTLKYFRPEIYQGIKLDSIKILGIGSEPILPGSVDKFCQFFKRLGLDPSTLRPGYGLAENTLGVSLDTDPGGPHVDSVRMICAGGKERAEPAPQNDSKAHKYVSSGYPLENVNLKILDQKGDALPERCIGEIVFNSPYMFKGYLDGKLSCSSPQAGANGYFRTGDMGYIANGKLYVCGRSKDLIIMGGGNFFAEDLEAALDSISGVSPRSSVILGISDPKSGTENVIVLAGIYPGLNNDTRHEIDRSIRRILFQSFGITAQEVHLVKPNWITKTHNGKVSRAAARFKYAQWKKEGRLK